jgi:dolichol-phosphate mannosyltransferase
MRIFSDHKPFWLLLAGTFAVHSLLMAVPPLNSDEAFIWEWSRHLALGYYSHPPMSAWVLAAVTALLGTSAYTVRLGSLLLHLGTVALLYRACNEILPARRMTLLALVTFVLLPVSVLLGTMVSSDMALLFFWMATAWLTKRAIVDGERSRWYLAGVTAGAMLLSKFFAVLFFPGLLAFLLLHRDYRRELARKEPWIAAVIALAVFSPFIYWNATHQWLTFQFNLENRQAGAHLDPLRPLLYVAGQMIAASPAVLVALVVALAAVLAAGWRRLRRPRPTWVVQDAAAEGRRLDGLLCYAVLTAAPLLVFVPVSLRSVVGAHWAAVVFPTGMLVLTAWLYDLPGTRVGAHGPRLRMRTTWVCGVLLLASSLPLMVIVLYPRVLPQRFIAYDEARQKSTDVAQYWGWQEVGRRIGELRAQYGSLPGGLWFSTRDYSDASLLGFYSTTRERFALMGYRRDEIHGRDFLYWAAPVKQPGSNSIFVMDEPFPNNLERVQPYFREVRPLDPPLVIRDPEGRVLRKYFFALCLDYQGGEPDVLSRW